MAEDIGNGSTGQDIPQPTSFAFDAESDDAIARIVVKFPEGRQASAVLPLLDIAQRQMARTTGSAWVPRVAMDAIAARLAMPPIRVYEVATFYLMFNTTPVGAYHLQICTTTPCWLRGSEDITAACRAFTGIEGWHETSADGLFTMSEVECLGACVNAPILQVNDDYYEDLTGPRTTDLLSALKLRRRPRPGPVDGRVASAPEGGPTTLTTLTATGGPPPPTVPAYGSATYPVAPPMQTSMQPPAQAK